MSGIVKSGQGVTCLFTTASPSTGAATDADSTPTGTLYVNGTANGASVAVTNVTTGVYKVAVTLPALTAGDIVDIRISATVSSTAGEGVVWSAVADTVRLSELPTAASNADAVWDEASADHVSAGSFGKLLADFVDQSSVTVVTAVSGSTVTVYTDSYWSFAISGLGDTSGYETLLLTVKDTPTRADGNATLYLRSDTGLIAIDGSAPADAGNGALTNDGTGFTATVEMAETANMSAQQNLTWWLKGLDTTPEPDTATVIASGTFNVLASGVKATS